MGQPACTAPIMELRDALMEWMLFSARTHTYLDYDAPLISGSNVLALTTGMSSRRWRTSDRSWNQNIFSNIGQKYDVK